MKFMIGLIGGIIASGQLRHFLSVEYGRGAVFPEAWAWEWAAGDEAVYHSAGACGAGNGFQRRNRAGIWFFPGQKGYKAECPVSYPYGVNHRTQNKKE